MRYPNTSAASQPRSLSKPRPFRYNALALACSMAMSGYSIAQADNSVLKENNLEEVVVTGQKIERSLQDTAASIDVVSGEELNDFSINTLDDVYSLTANVASTFGGTGFVIRGIANTNVTGAGIADLATIFIDGAPAARDITFAGPLELWDIKQVEIIRGPQSTLQGRNTLAGAVIINTEDPSYEWQGRGRIQYLDETKEQRYSIAVGGPIVDDQLAFRIAAETSKADNLIFNSTRNEDVNAVDTQSLRAKLLIEPKAIPDLSIKLTHSYDKREYGDDISILSVPNAFDNRQLLNDAPIEENAEFNISTVQLDYELNDTWSLTWLTTADKSKRDRQRDGDLSAENRLVNSFRSEPETLTTELRATFQTDTLSGVVGAFYSNYDATDQEGLSRVQIAPESLGLAGILSAPPFGLDPATIGFVLAQYGGGFTLDTFGASPIEIETSALFGDITWDINESWRLFAGFRYDREKQDQGTTQRIELNERTVIPNPADFGPLAPVFAGINGFILAQIANANSEDRTANTDFDAFLPKLGVSYNFTDEMSTSFIVQRGYRSGGTGVNIAKAAPFTFDQEFIWNYELSFRSEWLEGRLTVNANAFYIDWEDQQTTVYLSNNVFDTETQNVGESSVRGFEIEANYAVNDNLKVFANYGYAKTEIESDFRSVIFVEDPTTGATIYNSADFAAANPGTPIGDNLRGNEFGTAPRSTFSMGFVYQHANGFFASVDYNFVDETFERINTVQNQAQINRLVAEGKIPANANIEDEVVPSQSVLNAKIGYQQDNWGVFLIGKNILEDEFFYNDFFVGNSRFGRLNNPRVLGLSIEASF